MTSMRRPATAALAALLLAAGCTLQSSPDGNPATGANLAGAWRSSVQFSEGLLAPMKDLEFLYAFNGSGTMTESSNYDEAPPVTPAYGVWRQMAPNRFEAKYVFYNTKPPAKVQEIAAGGGWLPSGRGVLTETFTLAADGQAYESTIAMEMFDGAGKPMAGGGHAKGHGTRIQF